MPDDPDRGHWTVDAPTRRPYWHSGREIIGPKHTPDGWKASARPRHPLKRFLGGAYGIGDTPDEALHNLAEVLRDRAKEDPYDGPFSDDQ